MERCTLPVKRTEDDRDHTSFFCIVAFHRALHFNTVTVARSKEVRAYKQKDNVSTIQMCVNFICPFYSSTDITVMPSLDKALQFEDMEMFFQLLTQRFVLVSIRIEYL